MLKGVSWIQQIVTELDMFLAQKMLIGLTKQCKLRHQKEINQEMKVVKYLRPPLVGVR